jgi:hypothetical protein
MRKLLTFLIAPAAIALAGPFSAGIGDELLLLLCGVDTGPTNRPCRLVQS